MPSTTLSGPVISAEQIANYVVCPEAWRLKYIEGDNEPLPNERTKTGRELRQNWVKQQDLSATLRNYAMIVYLLLVLLSIVVFILEHYRSKTPWRPDSSSPSIYQQSGLTDDDFDSSLLSPSKSSPYSPQGIPTEIVLLLLILGLIIFIWDLLDRKSSKLRKSSGLGETAKVVSLRGGDYLPGKELFSEQNQLTSKPDALIEEDGFLIPVDVKPMAKKIRDRHVVEVLLHLKLIEEKNNTRPPYGVLLMGQEKRLVRISNTDGKQRWLQSLIDEMRSIVDGIPAVPAPAVNKCKHCDVRQLCVHSLYDSSKG